MSGAITFPYWLLMVALFAGDTAEPATGMPMTPQPELTGLPTYEVVDASARTVLDASADYRPLSIEQCRQRAGDHATDLVARASPETESNADLRATLVRALRNEAVAAASSSYVHLSLAQAQREWLKRRLDEFDNMLTEGDRLVERGVHMQILYDALRRERMETLEEVVELDRHIAEHNLAMRQLLGDDDPAAPWRYWPTSPLSVHQSTLDADAAVDTALAQRAEFELIEAIRQTPAAAAIELFDAVMLALPRAADVSRNNVASRPLLDVGRFRTIASGVNGGRATTPEWSRRQRKDLERIIRGDIAAAKLRLDATVQQIVLVDHRASSWATTIQGLESRTVTGESTFQEVGAARIAFYRAKSELLAQIADWNVAAIESSRAQGQWAAADRP